MSRFRPGAVAICVLLAATVPADVEACVNRHQVRHLPLGLVGDDVVILELDMSFSMGPIDERSGKSPERPRELYWEGAATLKRFDTDRVLVSEEPLGELRLDPDSYLEDLEATYLASLSKAREWSGFVPLEPRSLSVCDFQRVCHRVELESRGAELFVRLKEAGRTVRVDDLDDPTSPARGVLLGISGDGPEVSPRLVDAIEVSSVRSHVAGSRTLWVVHLATRQKKEGVGGGFPDREEYRPEGVPFDRLESALFREPSGWHGEGFDFWVLLPSGRDHDER